jgi:hypothetical protein
VAVASGAIADLLAAAGVLVVLPLILIFFTYLASKSSVLRVPGLQVAGLQVVGTLAFYIFKVIRPPAKIGANHKILSCFRLFQFVLIMTLNLF